MGLNKVTHYVFDQYHISVFTMSRFEALHKSVLQNLIFWRCSFVPYVIKLIIMSHGVEENLLLYPYGHRKFFLQKWGETRKFGLKP
jgi:hypothetical protein